MIRLFPLLLVACAHHAPQYPSRSMRPIAPNEAIQRAWSVLADQGSGSVEVCSVEPIVAPLGGYLVDFRGNWVREGVAYRTVRVGIPDGTEPDRTEPFFALIAHGQEWFPESPDVDHFVSDFEYLGDRAAFERGDCGA